MSVTIEIEGLKEVQNSLKLLGKKVGSKAEKSVTMKALRAGGKPILKEAKSRAPKGRKGRLRRSLAIKNTKGRLEVQIGARRGKSREDRLGAWYAHMVEFGTINMSARPFLRPAVDAKSGEAVAVLGATLFKLIAIEASK
jgi:HK97 gp10 family phage protein